MRQNKIIIVIAAIAVLFVCILSAGCIGSSSSTPDPDDAIVGKWVTTQVIPEYYSTRDEMDTIYNLVLNFKRSGKVDFMYKDSEFKIINRLTGKVTETQKVDDYTQENVWEWYPNGDTIGSYLLISSRFGNEEGLVVIDDSGNQLQLYLIGEAKKAYSDFFNENNWIFTSKDSRKPLSYYTATPVPTQIATVTSAEGIWYNPTVSTDAGMTILLYKRLNPDGTGSSCGYAFEYDSEMVLDPLTWSQSSNQVTINDPRMGEISPEYESVTYTMSDDGNSLYYGTMLMYTRTQPTV